MKLRMKIVFFSSVVAFTTIFLFLYSFFFMERGNTRSIESFEYSLLRLTDLEERMNRLEISIQNIESILSRKSSSEENTSQLFSRDVNLEDWVIDLSGEIDLLQQHIQAEVCIAEKKPHLKTLHGGYCSNTIDLLNSAHSNKGHQYYFLPKLAEYLQDRFFEGKTVADFGAGDGSYCKWWNDVGKVKSSVCYDGASGIHTATDAFVKFLNLARKVPITYEVPVFDWVFSHEVGEHIPMTYEGNFIDNLIRHSREGVIVSWCPSKNENIGHVNPRGMEYVVEQFTKRGMIHSSEERDRFISWGKQLQLQSSSSSSKKMKDNIIPTLHTLFFFYHPPK